MAGALSLLDCGVSVLDIQLSTKAQKQQHYEIIQTLQPLVDRRQQVPSSQLMFLAGAYSETRNYARLFPILDLWQGQIEGGDNRMFGGELSAMPHFMRASTWLDLGNPQQALVEAQAAEAILGRQTYAINNFIGSFQIDTWSALGVAQAQLGNGAEAEACVHRLEGVDLSGTINGPQKYAAIAKVQMALGHYPQALAAVQDPHAKYNGLARLFYDNTFQIIPVAFIQAKCQFETGRLDEARAGYDRLLEHPHLAEVGGIYWPILLDRARIAQREGQAGLAEGLLRKAVDVIEEQRASIGNEAGRIGFVGDKQACYQDLVALLVQAGRAREAFAFVERAKGRALVDLLASQKHLVHGQAARALDVLDQAERDLGAIPDPSAPGRRGIAVSARQELRAQAPELASLVSVPQISVATLQERLEADESLLEYFQVGDQWLAFVVTRDAVRARSLGTPDLGTKVRELRRVLANPALDAAPALADLSSAVLDPIAAQLRAPKLTIVPHGVLHYVPFCALGQGGAALLDQHALRILPSATILAFLKPGKTGGGSLLLGNPDLGRPDLDLPFAQEEVAALAAFLPQPTLKVRKEATADAITGSAGRFAIIHVAAHGFFDDGRPLESALLLAPASGSRGTLSVADLYPLDLDADLVTLSACETALSKVSRGDDVVGFTRGLLFAGSRSVLSSLWKVDDRCTKDLMIAFYQGLGTRSKAEALAAAQRTVRAVHPHPYYWAAFMLTGNSGWGL